MNVNQQSLLFWRLLGVCDPPVMHHEIGLPFTLWDPQSGLLMCPEVKSRCPTSKKPTAASVWASAILEILALFTSYPPVNTTQAPKIDLTIGDVSEQHAILIYNPHPRRPEFGHHVFKCSFLQDFHSFEDPLGRSSIFF